MAHSSVRTLEIICLRCFLDLICAILLIVLIMVNQSCYNVLWHLFYLGNVKFEHSFFEELK